MHVSQRVPHLEIQLTPLKGGPNKREYGLLDK